MGLIRAFIARDTMQAHFVRNLMEREGIPAEIFGDQLQGMGGMIPAIESTWPTVWVPEEDRERAAGVIRDFESGAQRQASAVGRTWKCAQCGELIEPQFTDCWNCGASQSEGEADPSEIEQVDPNTPMDLDVSCVGCGYNLRGLFARGRCPECGQAIVPSLLAAIADLSPEDYVEIEVPLRQLIEASVQGLGYPPTAVLFLLKAWTRAIASAPSAVAMSWTVADVALEQFSTLVEALTNLKSWGIADCRALGASLFALAEHGLLNRVDGLRIEDFPDAPIESIFPPRGPRTPRSISDVQL